VHFLDHEVRVDDAKRGTIECHMFRTPISLNGGSPQVGAERVSSVDEGRVDDKR
jgi:hypothetical protein